MEIVPDFHSLSFLCLASFFFAIDAVCESDSPPRCCSWQLHFVDHDFSNWLQLPLTHNFGFGFCLTGSLAYSIYLHPISPTNSRQTLGRAQIHTKRYIPKLDRDEEESDKQFIFLFLCWLLEQREREKSRRRRWPPLQSTKWIFNCYCHFVWHCEISFFFYLSQAPFSSALRAGLPPLVSAVSSLSHFHFNSTMRIFDP